jgi:hypothetical protein
MLWVCGSTGVGSCESKCRGVGSVGGVGGMFSSSPHTQKASYIKDLRGITPPILPSF